MVQNQPTGKATYSTKEAIATPALQGINMNKGRKGVDQRIYTSERVCFDGETHHAKQYIIRELALRVDSRCLS